MGKKETNVRMVSLVARSLSRWAPGVAAAALAGLFIWPSRRSAPAREAAWMEGAERTTLVADGRRLAVYSWGRGPTVLLVHGWAGRGSQLAVYARPLVELGYRVVAFDAPAHGASEGRVLTLPGFARAIQLVADREGPLEAVVSHSLGAAATTLAISRGMRVGRAVYLAPPENLPGYLFRLARHLGFSDDIAAGAQRRLERRIGFPFEEARGSWLAPQQVAPLLVLHDPQDREVPFEEGERLVALWRGAELVPVQGLGHNRIVRDESVIRHVVGWLSQGPRLRAAS